MNMSRILKWAAAGVLALGTVPAVGFARARGASLPTDVSVTPTSMVTPVSINQTARRTRSKKSTRRHKVSSKRHAKAKHKRVHARSKASHSKGRTHKASHSRHSLSHKKTKRA